MEQGLAMCRKDAQVEEVNLELGNHLTVRAKEKREGWVRDHLEIMQVNVRGAS